MMKTPEIRIYFSPLLYDRVSVPLNKLWNQAGAQEFATPEQCERYAGNYRQEWAKYSDKIIPNLEQLLGVDFYQAVIDAPCVPWVRTISDPLTLNFRYMPDQFVDILTHELCHILLTDNTSYSIKSSPKEIYLDDRWRKLFGDELDFETVVHIPVHALCKYVYLDVLQQPSRLERDVDNVKGDPPYKAAWDYVIAHDYKQIIEQLKQDYKEIEREIAK